MTMDGPQDEQWLGDYRKAHPVADRWARGSTTVRHTSETQSRIFRMAEQLRVSRDWSDGAPLFSMLRALDDLVDSETYRDVSPAPSSAAAAGLAGYKMLFGKLPALQALEWPKGFERVDEDQAELFETRLRAQGFDPIVLDGTDPAAYLWALFEMCERQAASAEVNRLHEHPACEPRCLAVVPREQVRRRLPQTIERRPSEAVGAAGR
jgi:hypothetical protein